MIRGIHYFSTEVKTKIDVIPRGCFNFSIFSLEKIGASIEHFKDLIRIGTCKQTMVQRHMRVLEIMDYSHCTFYPFFCPHYSLFIRGK